MLGGGLSAWARGGPKSEHDVDFLVRPDDADAALAAFERGRLEDGAAARGLARQDAGTRTARSST